MNTWKMLLVGTILLLNLVLHIHNYAVYPQRGATSDEYTYSFLGISLLTKHVPISWSNVAPYPHRTDLTIDHLYFPIVSPYFDHPPLNGLLVGSFALLQGENTFQKVQLSTVRLVPIFLTLLSALLVFLLAYRLFSYTQAVWALLIYSTTTIFVINTRIGFAENLLTPLLLFSIYLFTIFDKRMTAKKAILLGLLTGLSFWTKELGIVTFFTLSFFFVWRKIRWKFFISFLLTSCLFFLLYLGYGDYYDWNLFWAVISAQSNRPIGPEVLQMLIFQPVIVNKPYFDGWYFLGFVALFASFVDFKKYSYVLIPSFLYFLLLIFSLNRDGQMGWYVIPLFPFMAIAVATALHASLQKSGWFLYILLVFAGLYEIQYLYEASFGLTPVQFRIMLILLFAPLIVLHSMGKEKLAAKLGLFWFYLLIVGNVVLTYTYIHPA